MPLDTVKEDCGTEHCGSLFTYWDAIVCILLLVTANCCGIVSALFLFGSPKRGIIDGIMVCRASWVSEHYVN